MTAVLFDLDGTLMDTPRVIVRSLRHILGTESQSYDDTDLARHVGRPLDVIMADLFPEASAADVEEKKQEFREAFRSATVPDARELVFANVHGLLTQLENEGIATAIVTSKVTSSALELLEAGQIRSSFAAVIGHDQASSGKPAPDLALLAAARLRTEPGECLVVGDSPDDMRMGVAAGMFTIGVTWGVGDHDTLRTSGASTIATTGEELESSILATADQNTRRGDGTTSKEPMPYA